jgi:hypothetical protein
MQPLIILLVNRMGWVVDDTSQANINNRNTNKAINTLIQRQ